MKQLTCEMCGSTDLIKDGGVFVCQTCGTKYSVEEAKKMMIEGTVDVSGSTVKVDNTDQIEKYVNLSKQAYKSGNGESAFNYANKALEIDPGNVDAWIATMMSIEHLATLGDLRLTEIIEAGNSAIEYSGDNKAGVENDVYLYQLNRALDLIKFAKTKMLDTREIRETYQQFYNIDRSDAGEHVSQLDSVEVNLYDGIAAEAIEFASQIADKCLLTEDSAKIKERTALIKQCINEYQAETDAVNKRLGIYGYSLLKSAIEHRNTTKNKIQAKVDKALNNIKQIEERQKKERFDAYWAEHTAERQQLESEKEGLKKQIDELKLARTTTVNAIKNEMNSVSEDEEISSIKLEIKKLQQNRDSLGLFKGKEKKAIQEQIDQLDSRIKAIEKRIKEKKSEIESKARNEHNSFDSKISPLEKRIKEIDAELTKPR